MARIWLRGAATRAGAPPSADQWPRSAGWPIGQIYSVYCTQLVANSAIFELKCYIEDLLDDMVQACQWKRGSGLSPKISANGPELPLKR